MLSLCFYQKKKKKGKKEKVDIYWQPLSLRTVIKPNMKLASTAKRPRLCIISTRMKFYK